MGLRTCLATRKARSEGWILNFNLGCLKDIIRKAIGTAKQERGFRGHIDGVILK